MEPLDFFRFFVLAQIGLVGVLYGIALVKDLVHLGKIDDPNTKQIFIGRVFIALAVVLLSVLSFLLVLMRLGEPDLNSFSIFGQAAMPCLVVGWGFAFRHRYTVAQ